MDTAEWALEVAPPCFKSQCCLPCRTVTAPWTRQAPLPPRLPLPLPPAWRPRFIPIPMPLLTAESEEGWGLPQVLLRQLVWQAGLESVQGSHRPHCRRTQAGRPGSWRLLSPGVYQPARWQVLGWLQEGLTPACALCAARWRRTAPSCLVATCFAGRVWTRCPCAPFVARRRLQH